MSEGTTKPNGGSKKLDVKNTDEVEQEMRDADYNVILNSITFQEVPKNKSEKGDYTTVNEATHTMSFEGMIGPIASGAKASTKEIDNQHKKGQPKKDVKDNQHKKDQHKKDEVEEDQGKDNI